MPPILQGSVTFPGIPPEAVVSCTYTRGHGITPGTAMLECKPLDDFEPTDGDLVFTFDTVTITLTACHLDHHVVRTGPQGKVWSLSILDRRWNWRFGEISGVYNRRVDNITFKQGDVDQERSPTDLMELCLDLMGETTWNLDQVPNDSRPFVEWDHDNPAQCLAALAEKLGCRVVLRVDDTVAVVKLGFGAELPDAGLPVMENSLSINPPKLPGQIKVVCAPTLYDAELELEAVGEDDDGIHRIGKLSYIPPRGWSESVPNSFLNIKDHSHRLMARKTVWRWYRIKTKEKDGDTEPFEHNIPGYGKATYRQLLPLCEELTLYVEDDDEYSENGQPTRKRLPAGVKGLFYNGANEREGGYKNTDPLEHNPLNTGADHSYAKPWTVDQDRGILMFDDYVIKFLDQLDAAGHYMFKAEADLKYQVGTTVRDPETYAYERYEKVLEIGGPGGGAVILKHDEIQLVYEKGQPANQVEVDQACDYYLAAALLEYQMPKQQDLLYAGLLPIELDGAVLQVTWSVGPQGTTTRAGRSTEYDLRIPSYNERRFFELLARRGMQYPDVIQETERFWGEKRWKKELRDS
jgi:hypothetical protein